MRILQVKRIDRCSKSSSPPYEDADALVTRGAGITREQLENSLFQSGLTPAHLTQPRCGIGALHT